MLKARSLESLAKVWKPNRLRLSMLMHGLPWIPVWALEVKACLLLKVKKLVWLPSLPLASLICPLTGSLSPEYKPISGGYRGTGKVKYLLNKYLSVYPNKYLSISTYAC